MLEYWSVGILEYWVKSRIISILKMLLIPFPIYKNPFFHYSNIPLFQYDGAVYYSG